MIEWYMNGNILTNKKERSNYMKCEKKVDKGKTRIRGWHNFVPCKNEAKYKVTYLNGNVELLCGVHLNKIKKLGYKIEVEKLKL